MKGVKLDKICPNCGIDLPADLYDGVYYIVEYESMRMNTSTGDFDRWIVNIMDKAGSVVAQHEEPTREAAYARIESLDAKPFYG